MFVTNIFSLPGDGALSPRSAGGGVAGVWLDHTLLVLGEDGDYDSVQNSTTFSTLLLKSSKKVVFFSEISSI